MHLILSNNALSQLNVYLGFYSKPCFRYFEFETLLFFLGDLCMQYMNTCVALEKALEKVLTTDGNTLSLYCARCALPIYNMPTIRSYVGHKYFIANGIHKKR